MSLDYEKIFANLPIEKEGPDYDLRNKMFI